MNPGAPDNDPADAHLDDLLIEAVDAEGALDHTHALDIYRLISTRVVGTPLALEAQRRHAELLLKLGRNDEAVAAFDNLIASCEKALSETPEDPALRVLTGALAERAHAAYRSGDGASILTFSERSVATARLIGDPALIAHGLRFVGIAHEFAGRHDAAERTYLELLEVAPDTRHLGPVCNSLGEIARASGRFSTAVSWYRRYLEEWRKTHGDEPNIVYLNNTGAALVELGETAEGRALLDRAIAEQRRSGYLAMLSETYHYRALSHLLEGKLSAATEDTIEGYMLAQELGEGEMVGVLMRLLGRIRQQQAMRGPLGDSLAGIIPLGELPPEATSVELVRKSVAILEGVAKPAEVARSRWLLGEIYQASGDLEQAAVELEAAHAAFTELGLGFWAERVAESRGGTTNLL
jgi:tetratricopeptide (TPR) repeat protein